MDAIDMDDGKAGDIANGSGKRAFARPWLADDHDAPDLHPCTVASRWDRRK
jgi:hypothetical protein